MARTNFEWVAQVSFFETWVFPARTHLRGETQVSKRDLGHPLKVWRLQVSLNRFRAHRPPGSGRDDKGRAAAFHELSYVRAEACCGKVAVTFEDGDRHDLDKI